MQCQTTLLLEAFFFFFFFFFWKGEKKDWDKFFKTKDKVLWEGEEEWKVQKENGRVFRSFFFFFFFFFDKLLE